MLNEQGGAYSIVLMFFQWVSDQLLTVVGELPQTIRILQVNTCIPNTTKYSTVHLSHVTLYFIVVQLRLEGVPRTTYQLHVLSGIRSSIRNHRAGQYFHVNNKNNILYDTNKVTTATLGTLHHSQLYVSHIMSATILKHPVQDQF